MHEVETTSVAINEQNLCLMVYYCIIEKFAKTAMTLNFGTVIPTDSEIPANTIFFVPRYRVNATFLKQILM
jgi:hypothetical protein